MPQTAAKPTGQAAASQSAPAPGALASTAQYLVFDPGLFVMELVAPQSVATPMGLRLPALRLDSTPPAPDHPGRAVAAGAIEAGWIFRSDAPVFVLVTGGRAGMVLTIYRADGGTAPPEVRFRQVHTSLAGSPEARGEEADVEAGAVPLTVLTHIRNTGDVTGPGGRWMGRAGSNGLIEGFAITPAAAISKSDLEYQAILGNSWNTPWFAAGEFCGSRGMLLPLLGFRVRLKGAAAEAYECRYMGCFAGTPDPVASSDGEACSLGDAPLEAMHIIIVKRENGVPEATETTEAKTKSTTKGRTAAKPLTKPKPESAAKSKPDVKGKARRK